MTCATELEPGSRPASQVPSPAAGPEALPSPPPTALQPGESTPTPVSPGSHFSVFYETKIPELGIGTRDSHGPAMIVLKM
jgi:hypothetical protein